MTEILTLAPKQTQARSQQLELFTSERLPLKPYCSDNKTAALIRPLPLALKQPYMQVNVPSIKWWMVFDVDRPKAALAWEDAGLPPPAWACTDPQTTRGHLAYALEVPVVTSQLARIKPLQYLRHVEYGIATALKADIGYTGLITKNPTHLKWKTWIGPQVTYLLEEIGEYIDLPKKIPKKAAEYGVGRNVDTFENLRLWAYSHVMQAKRESTYGQWAEACIGHAESFNMLFKTPLGFPEIRAIGKSVAKWTWNHFGQGVHGDRFIERQRNKGRLGGLKSGAVRFEGSAERKAPWVEMGISRRMYYYRKSSNLIALEA